MSQSRQLIPEPEILVRSSPHGIPSGIKLPFFQRDWVQLVYAIEGVMTVASDQETWIVPPLRAVWVPAGVRHEVTSHGRLSLRSLYFHAGPRFPKSCGTVSVSPLAREMINYVAMAAPLMRANAAHRRLTAVLLDLLFELPTLPLHLPHPKTKEASEAALLLGDWDMDLVTVARRVGLSKRTLERRFAHETGLSVGVWRQQARLIASIRMLAAGSSVTEVSLAVGYQSASAYSAAFKKTFGVTPGEMFIS